VKEGRTKKIIFPRAFAFVFSGSKCVPHSDKLMEGTLKEAGKSKLKTFVVEEVSFHF